jgi:TP901 family phage tail tape measure protein
MAQTVDLLVKVQDAEAKVKLDKITNDIRKAQQLAQEGITITSSSVKEDANGLVTAITKYIDAEKRLITLKQQEYVVQEEIRNEEGKITQERQTAIRDTKTISTNYAQIAKELSRMEAESAKITAETERLAQNAERAKAAFAKSLTGKTRENYQNGGYSAEFASEVQSATTVAWQQYSASLTEAYQKQSQLNAETSMFGQISDSAFAQYSSGAMSAAVAQKDVNTAQEQSVEAIAHGIVTAQQFFNTMNGVGRQCGVTADEVSVFAELSDDAFHKYAGGLMSASDANKTLKNSTKEVTEETKKSRGEFTLLNTVLIRLAHTALSAVTRAFREALTEMKNVDSALVVVRKVSDASSDELLALKERAYEVGAAYGVLASDYLNAAAEMTRAGYREQAGDLAQLATKLQLVGDVSQDVANQFLIATDKSYKMNGNYQKLSETIDKLNEIDNNFATSFEKVADGIGLLAPVAAQANVSFDEMAAAIGTVTAVTQRSGTEAARALRSLFINILKDTTTEIDEGVTWTVDEINSLSDALKKYAPEVVKAAEATGDLINPMEALAALAQSYKDGLLTNQDLFEITSGLGGKLRTSQLLALIQNWDMYNQMLDKTAEAAGSADKEVQNALDSWEVKLNQLKNTFTEFVQKSLSTDFIKVLLDSVKWLIEGFGDLGTVVGIFGTALLALKIPSIIQGFTNLTTMIQKVGGGFTNVITVLFNYKTMSGLVEGSNYAQAKSFAAANAAASMFSLVIAGVTLAISAAIIAIKKYTQGLDDTISRGEQAYKELQTIGEIEKSYEELKEQYKQGSITQSEYASGKDEIIAKLNAEGVQVDELRGKYGALESSIDDAIEKSKTYKLIEVEDAIRAAEKKANGTWTWNAVGYSNDALWADYYLGSGIHPLITSKTFDGYSIEELVSLYDLAIKRREELYSQKKHGSTEDKRLESFINTSKELVTEYKELIKIRDELNGVTEESSNTEDSFVSTTNEEVEAVSELADEVDKATSAIERYNNALKESGERNDDFKSYADAYKKAVEMYEKGLTGSNQYMAAIDLLFDSGIVKSYEEAGELLGSKFIQAAFEGGADDFGANAANYIKNHIDEFSGVSIREADNGTFSLIVTDMEEFAKSAQLSEGAVSAIVEALGAYDSKELDGTIKTVGDFTKESHPIEMPAESEDQVNGFFGNIVDWINKLDGSAIHINVIHGDANGNGGGGSNYVYEPVHSNGGRARASGVRKDNGGLALVNEEGAELIYSNGSAWIAGGGNPTITNIPQGAGVFNARETRDILTRSGIPSFVDPQRSGVGGFLNHEEWLLIPEGDDILKADDIPDTNKKKDKKLSLQDILEQLSEYIDEILKKAKEALQEQLDAIDEQIDKLKREHDAEEDANKLEELRLKILEAEKKLAEAENERTVRYFNKETGQWEWMADQKAVEEARKALEDAQKEYDDEVAQQEYEAQLQALQDQKDALNDAYNDLADRWNKILEALQESENGSGTTDIAKLLESLGKISGGTSSDDIAKILEELARFTENPSSVLDAETTARIMSMNGASGGATSVLSAMLGSGSYDLNGRGQSTLGGNTSIVGDTIYYINGVQIGSDMMDKPLSQILSVLPIYAN